MTGPPSGPSVGRLETKRAPGALAVGSDGTFAGYAALFGVPDLGRDVILPGAFRASLARRGAAGIRMLWQHDPGEPVGRWLAVAEDARGLRVRGRLAAGVARARELAWLLAEGALDGLSIGFRTVEATRDRATGLRRLAAIDLWEVSLVTFPMQPGARIDAPRSPPDDAAVALAIRAAARRLSTRPSHLTRFP
ncbi:MAG: HK97 family phage prohead protease [Methylobacteriaceae bacterium]|nr:HK97 family phage prohead protease [Methylobacteriaceae bacterium]